MKQNATPMIALTVGLLTGMPLMSHAQTTLPAADAPIAPLVPMVASAQTKTLAPEAPARMDSKPVTTAEEEAKSLTALLRLSTTQITQLDRSYQTYARARVQQEAQIANWQEDLRDSQAIATFDERKSSQLAGNISGAENKIANAYIKARGEALNVLTQQQKFDLGKIHDGTQPVVDDKYRFLLLSEVEELWRTPIDSETGQALLNTNATSKQSASSQQSYYQNYYATPPVYVSPYYASSYGFGWNSYYNDWNFYGYQSPFYVRPGYGWNGGNYYNNNNYYNYNRVDKNARPRWDRSDTYSRPSVNDGFRSDGPRRPLYTPPGSSSNRGDSRQPVARPREDSSPGTASPTWDRQRETPRPTPSSNGDSQGRAPRRPEQPRPDVPRPEAPRPEPPKSEPTRPEPSRPDPPRADPPRPERSNDDGGNRWDRGGGGRGNGGDGGGGGGRGGGGRGR
jgi:uncharacterized membrane protein YgcG/Spy/CpxP family protein refolding chaperone